ncbi:Bacteriocin UviA [bioreactor metagenome]|uniref:Bacteriocin UviA n=1 Tax=bioreactor metagenome TaxID=1076179 RepID=A0A644YRH7_9ZZZZ
MIVDLIVLSQAGSSEATLELIHKFDPLLKKYAYKLYYEDAYNDLVADFIELLKNIRTDTISSCEGSLVSYIAKAVRNSYIKRSIAHSRQRNFIPYSAFDESELYRLEAESATVDETTTLDLCEIGSVLTEAELSVIKMLYFSGYTVNEVALSHGISRQAVNQMKKRALLKLRKWLGQA